MEFNELIADCAEKQKLGYLKTSICQLLETISDQSEAIVQSDFITHFIINFAVDSIK
jgi:hypothetical protein